MVVRDTVVDSSIHRVVEDSGDCNPPVDHVWAGEAVHLSRVKTDAFLHWVRYRLSFVYEIVRPLRRGRIRLL